MKQFKFSEKEIRDAAFNDEGRYNKIREQYTELVKLMNSIGAERSRARNDKRVKDKIDALKALPVDTPLWYCNNNWSMVPFGTEVIKRRNGIKYMVVEIPNKGLFKIPYLQLESVKPSDETIRSNRTMVKVFRNM